MTFKGRQEKRNCKFHHPIMRQDIGVRHFLNTGEPYIIEQCPDCKLENVRELPIYIWAVLYIGGKEMHDDRDRKL